MQIEIEMQQTPQQRQQPYPPSPPPPPVAECVCETMWGASTWLSSAQLNLLNILKNLSRHKSAPGHVNPIFIFTFVRIQTMFRVWCFSPHLPTAPPMLSALHCLVYSVFSLYFFCFSVFFFSLRLSSQMPNCFLTRFGIICILPELFSFLLSRRHFLHFFLVQRSAIKLRSQQPVHK